MATILERYERAFEELQMLARIYPTEFYRNFDKAMRICR